MGFDLGESGGFWEAIVGFGDGIVEGGFGCAHFLR